MRFVVIADTHVRSPDAEPGDFPANTHLEGRNRHAVEIIEAIAPEFVIHLGDVVHPVPGSPEHSGANDLARAAYRGLPMPLYVVPGNHDVGDKPYRWVDAPSVDPTHYDTFTRGYGPRHQEFTRGGCRFVLIDTPVMSTGWEAEAEQWAWLERTLGEARDMNQRIFLFGHYPPYLWDPGEPEHYDNLAPRARARLLELIDDHGVEAVFSGHVHRFFHRRHHRTDLYVAPATGFVRPEYAELDPVAPRDQFGRDDRAKLGLLTVEITAAGHTIRPLRTWGRTAAVSSQPIAELADPTRRCHLGVTMSQPWASPRDLATGGLDRFVRKRVRDDSAVLALWESGINHVRVPLADLTNSDSRQRLEELAERGTQVTVIVPGALPTPLPDHRAVTMWEVVVAPGGSWPVGEPSGYEVPVAVGPLVPRSGSEWGDGHFVSHGFDPWGDPAEVRELTGGADRAVFRVRPHVPVWEGVRAAAACAHRAGKGAHVVVELPEDGEGRMFTDEVALAHLLVEAELAARAHPTTVVVLDGFSDRDRGYFPRIGPLDRRGDPRPALIAYQRLLSRLGPDPDPDDPWTPTPEAGGGRLFACRGGELALTPSGLALTTPEGTHQLTVT